MSEHFPKPFEHSGENIKSALDLSHYATKVEVKKAASVYTSNLAARSDLASLKAEIDKIGTDKLKTVLVNLYKPSNLADNYVVKKKVNAIDNSGLF